MNNTETQFKKGMTPWNKDTVGIVKANSGSFKAGSIPVNKIGTVKICTICQVQYSVRGLRRREKSLYCSRSCTGKSRPSPMKGKSVSDETKLKIRTALLGIRGKDHWNYRGYNGRTERKIAMSQDEYIQWRKAVFSRDDYTCQHCGVRGVYLEADHIKPWVAYPDLRYDIANGRTLCNPCHRKTPTWGVKAKQLIKEVG